MFCPFFVHSVFTDSIVYVKYLRSFILGIQELNLSVCMLQSIASRKTMRPISLIPFHNDHKDVHSRGTRRDIDSMLEKDNIIEYR